MAQARKSSSGSTKLASAVASKAAKNTYAAVESTRNSAENVVKFGGRAAKDFITTSKAEAQKAQDKMIAITREGAAQFSKSADVATKALQDVVSVTRDNIEAIVGCGNVTAALAQDLSNELFETANKNFTDSVETTKDWFACRTLNDLVDLQNRAVKHALDSAFAQTTRLSNLWFEYSSEALEPLNERVAQAGEKLSKTLTAA